MKWKKLGLVFRQDGAQDWRLHSALTPTPYLLNDDTIRVYAGFRDKEGISRIGYVDLDARNPTVVKTVSKQPVLDIGRPGCFDDNGMILGDIVAHENKLRMYYVGFQLVKQAKFLAFSGVAESDDGETFTRLSEAPVLDRAHGATIIRAIHCVRYEAGIWKVWYTVGDGWQYINNVPYPKYNIWYTESHDGLQFQQLSHLCIDVEGDEYRIGKPAVYMQSDEYIMLFTKGSVSGKDYFSGVARSKDGINWTRHDADLGLSLSPTGFDSEHLCYPRLITAHGKTYCIYSGNNMGVEGFGVAELIEW